MKKRNPNFSLKNIRKNKIKLEQKRAWTGDKHQDFEIQTCTLTDLLKYVTQPGYLIDTNPLFKVKLKKNRAVKK